MKEINWKVIIGDNNKIASVEHAKGIQTNDVENELLIIGILENLKQKHLQKLNTLFEKTVKR
jgi:hypothetical protein